MQKRVVIITVVIFTFILAAWSQQYQAQAQDPGQEGTGFAMRAARHLSGYLGREISIDDYAWNWSEQVWATPAMDCPDPNQTYPAVQTRGYEINIIVDNVTYNYRMSTDGLRTILCINGQPDASSIILNPTPIPPSSEPSIPTGTAQPSVTAQPTETPLPTTPPTPTLTPTPTVDPAFPEVMTNPSWEVVTAEFDEVEMVLLPAGCFQMGSELGDDDEKPQHEICFRTPFWLDKTEVTRAMYAACLADGACSETLESDFSSTDNQPINRVSWFQAVEYCTWRDMRLPTEAEWEYSARGPESLTYPWGEEFDAEALVFSQNAAGVTAEVGSREAGASWAGALDMSGNVWEWTSTLYLERRFPYPYDATDGREDPDNTEWARVIRGGSFMTEDAHDLRASYRNIHDPNDGEDGTIGFRCAKDFDKSDSVRVTPQPTFTPTPVVCNSAMPSRLVIGDLGQIDDDGDATPLNLRDNPSLSTSSIIKRYPALSQFEVLVGPTCDEDGNAWYQVKMSADGQTGWFIEAIGTDYTISPVLTPTPAPTSATN